MKKLYTKKGLWTLFLMCAFPVHVWSILLSFNDFSWVAERTTQWDAIGVVSYALLFAFIESLVVFVVVVLAGFLISSRWDEAHRITLLSAWVLVLAVYAMYVQAGALWGASLPVSLLQYAAQKAHPVRVIYLFLLGPVVLTVAIPTLVILFRDRIFRVVQSVFDRVALLTTFYLVFDALGLVIIVIRNIQ